MPYPALDLLIECPNCVVNSHRPVPFRSFQFLCDILASSGADEDTTSDEAYTKTFSPQVVLLAWDLHRGLVISSI